ncbi:MAG: phage tail protein [Candidatus Pacebacteria bacterium]|nr:phage tail protein [Candidatus Paceibacterota bacterium]
MATISDFAAHFKGGVRPNLFRVDIQGPEFFNNFHFFCKGAPIPASTVGAIDVPYRGRQLKVPGDRTYEEWTVTVLNDVDWQHRSAFENWSHRITAHSANVSDFESNDLGYYGNASVLHLDRSGTVMRRYVLEDIFPTSVAAIDLTSDGNDTVEEYTVGFAVNNVIIDGQGLDGSSSGSGFDISVGGKIDIGEFSVGFQF